MYTVEGGSTSRVVSQPPAEGEKRGGMTAAGEEHRVAKRGLRWKRRSINRVMEVR